MLEMVERHLRGYQELCRRKARCLSRWSDAIGHANAADPKDIRTICDLLRQSPCAGIAPHCGDFLAYLDCSDAILNIQLGADPNRRTGFGFVMSGAALLINKFYVFYFAKSYMPCVKCMVTAIEQW